MSTEDRARAERDVKNLRLTIYLVTQGVTWRRNETIPGTWCASIHHLGLVYLSDTPIDARIREGYLRKDKDRGLAVTEQGAMFEHNKARQERGEVESQQLADYQVQRAVLEAIVMTFLERTGRAAPGEVLTVREVRERMDAAAPPIQCPSINWTR